jgi:uncharacterized protein
LRQADALPRLILFTRWPAAGHVKTRLIPAIGVLGALSLHRNLSERTAQTFAVAANMLGAQAEVRFVGGSVQRMQKWLNRDWPMVAQGRGDIGARMERALTNALEGGAPVALLVGSDIPDLQPEHLIAAAAALNDVDVVLGPAKDGGYYLIGLKRPCPALFRGISWGSDRAFSQTVEKASSLGLRVAVLAELRDLDRPEDLANWPELAEWPARV